MILFSPIFGAVSLIILCAAYVTRCLRSPLNKIPGPFLARFTSLALKWHEMCAHRTMYIHSLHLRYGPVVRIAPNEVAFASQAGVREIYWSGGSGYDKTEFYDLFKVFGRRTMFTTLGKEDHARRKRIIADPYANTNILKAHSQDGILERAQSVIRKCETSVDGNLDLYITLHSYASDCATFHLFHPYGTDSLHKALDEAIMRQVTFDGSLQNRLVQHYSPTLHKMISRVLYLFAKPRETPLADNFVLESSEKADSAPFTLLTKLHDKSYQLEQIDVAAECLDHMAAGNDTTGDGLCFLMWQLSQPKSMHFQRRLQEELRSQPAERFDKLPFLDAIVMEGLRCFAPIPMSLPRYVPAGGRTIDGYYLPAQTIVSSQAHSAHRIETDVFPAPDLFNPERWLEKEGDAERKRLFFAFGGGSRGCVGRHLALAEMKILLREVYTRFTTLPDESMTAEMMEVSDQLISSRPKGQKCLVRFVPLADKETQQ